MHNIYNKSIIRGLICDSRNLKEDSEPKIKKDTINEGNINLYTKI